MSRFLVVAPSYRDTSGGRLVLHRLVDVLLRAGVDAALLPWKADDKGFAVCPRYRSVVASEARPDDVVIYPDVVNGNPLKARRSIRWLLYHPRYPLTKGEPVLHYAPAFGAGPYLTVTDSRLDLFENLHSDRFVPMCWTWRKASKQGWSEHDRPRHGYELTKGATLMELRTTFNTARRFDCYDNATFMAIQAKLCGCDVRVLSKTPINDWLSFQLGLPHDQLRLYLADRERVQAELAVDVLTRTAEKLK